MLRDACTTVQPIVYDRTAYYIRPYSLLCTATTVVRAVMVAASIRVRPPISQIYVDSHTAPTIKR